MELIEYWNEPPNKYHGRSAKLAGKRENNREKNLRRRPPLVRIVVINKLTRVGKYLSVGLDDGRTGRMMPPLPMKDKSDGRRLISIYCKLVLLPLRYTLEREE